MRIIPIQAMYKPNSSTVKNNYPKNVVDSPCSTVVELSLMTKERVNAYSLLFSDSSTVVELSSRKSIGLYNRNATLV